MVTTVIVHSIHASTKYDILSMCTYENNKRVEIRNKK